MSLFVCRVRLMKRLRRFVEGICGQRGDVAAELCFNGMLTRVLAPRKVRHHPHVSATLGSGLIGLALRGCFAAVGSHMFNITAS
jgi:hypothetical protein